jgi:hypothetical protein
LLEEKKRDKESVALSVFGKSSGSSVALLKVITRESEWKENKERLRCSLWMNFTNAN